jgi:hypothetical protein
VSTDVREELEATVAARRELGPGHDDELIAGFLERIDKEIDRKVDERVARRTKKPAKNHGAEEIGIFVPLFIIAGIFGGAVGIGACAAALIVVYLVGTFARR